MSEDLIAIGEVCGPQGKKGEVKVRLYYSNQQRLESVQDLFLLSPEGTYRQRTSIERLRYHRGTPVVHLAGFASRSDAENIRNFQLMVPETEMVELQADEYFWHDLLGSRVYDTHDRLLGTIQEIFETGSNDVLIVRGNNREYLIPLLKAILKVVDLAHKKIIIDPLPGLFATNED